MHLPTQKKIEDVAEIKVKLEENDIAIMTKFVGINVDKVTALRKQFREEGVDYKVYKNTLAKRALTELGLEAASEFMDGPTGWAFSNDPVAPAKILKEFSLQAKTISMVGGVLEGKVISAEQLTTLAMLPSRDQLLAHLVGTVAAPLRNFVGTLTAVPRNLVNVLDQIKKQKEEGAEEAA